MHALKTGDGRRLSRWALKEIRIGAIEQAQAGWSSEAVIPALAFCAAAPL